MYLIVCAGLGFVGSKGKIVPDCGDAYLFPTKERAHEVIDYCGYNTVATVVYADLQDIIQMSTPSKKGSGRK